MKDSELYTLANKAVKLVAIWLCASIVISAFVYLFSAFFYLKIADYIMNLLSSVL